MQQNQLQILQQQLQGLPPKVQQEKFTQIIHQIVPMFDTCGIAITQLSNEQCTTTMASEKRVHNQIGSIQSAGIILTAESAMGLAIGIHSPPHLVTLVRNVNTDFLKKVKGDIQAQAKLSPEQIALLNTQEKGSIELQAVVQDETKATVATCKATWVWFPAKS